MNIVVDTSVWSAALRKTSSSADDARISTLTGVLNQGRVVLLGLILQEILQGIRDGERFRELQAHMDAFPLIELEREDYIEAARLWNLCRARGFQAATADCQIAAACIKHNCALLTADRDFEVIAEHSPLQLI